MITRATVLGDANGSQLEMRSLERQIDCGRNSTKAMLGPCSMLFPQDNIFVTRGIKQVWNGAESWFERLLVRSEFTPRLVEASSIPAGSRLSGKRKPPVVSLC